MPNGPTPQGGGRQGGDGPGKWIALVFLVALACLGVYVVNEIMAGVRLQNCVLSGRRDCAVVSAPDR